MYCTPEPDSSSRIKTEKAVPIKPEKRENTKYNVPMSFALLDKNHLSTHMVIPTFCTIGLASISCNVKKFFVEYIVI